MLEFIEYRFQIQHSARIGLADLAVPRRNLKALGAQVAWSLQEELGRPQTNAATEHLRKRAWRRLTPSAVGGLQRILVVFVGLKEMHRVNLEFRKKDKPTDVLSFEPIEPGDLGEILICPQVILKNAQSYAVSGREELTRMLIHGTLHLLGLDHEKSQIENAAMLSFQESALAWIDMNEVLHRCAGFEETQV